MTETAFDFDWLEDGVARVSKDGELSGHNKVMRAWLRSVARLDDLPISEVEASQLKLGKSVEVRCGEALVRLRLCGEGEEQWLLASDATARRSIALERSSARLRLLGKIGGSIVHELANQMAAVVGYVEHLGDVVGGGDSEHLEATVERARETMVFLSNVVQLLERSPKDETCDSLVEVVRQAVEFTDKYARVLSRPIELDSKFDQTVSVRIATADALEILTTTLLFVLQSGSGGVRVAVESAEDGEGSMLVRIEDGGDVESYRALARALDGFEAYREFKEAGSFGVGLFRVVFYLRRVGGDAEFLHGDGRRTVLLRWPVFSRRS